MRNNFAADLTGWMYSSSLEDLFSHLFFHQTSITHSLHAILLDLSFDETF